MLANVALSSRHRRVFFSNQILSLAIIGTVLHYMFMFCRTDMATLFDVFCEVGAGGQQGLPVILTKYPEDYNDEPALKSVRQFSFPCGLKE